jgi:hypothetical protein
VAYNIAENGVGNVWLQPLDGSPGRRLTNFNSDRSFTFQFSPVGKSLGLVRTHVVSDVVLLLDTHKQDQNHAVELPVGFKKEKSWTRFIPASRTSVQKPR